MSENEFRYKAFISYSHMDRTWAEWLLQSLEAYKIPRNLVGRQTDMGKIPARLAPIFRDRDELPAAHRLTDRLFQAIQASEFMIVVCSPNSAKSTLVNREIIEFKRTHGDGRVLSIIIDGIPFSGEASTECFPEALRHSFSVNGQVAGLSAEGLAADVRAEGDGKRMALQKIVAGMLGVGLNDIVRRDELRRQRKTIAAMAASVIGMSMMGALTYEATTARETANKARELAEANQTRAESQLRQNEELMHFMMTNMYERLLEHGNLDVLDEITQKVLTSFEGRDLSTTSNVQLFHYTGTMLRLGQNLDRKGQSARAREIFDNVLKLARRFHAENPDVHEAVFRLQNNLFFTGYLALRQGRFEDAERDYRERLEINQMAINRQEELRQARTNHIETPAIWLVKLADSKMGLAQVLAGPLGRPNEAIPLHEESITHYREAVDIREGLKGTRIELASALHYAGQTYLAMGLLDKADEVFNARLAIYDELVADEPNNYRVFRRLLISKQNLAKLALVRGNLHEAFTLFTETAKGYDRLVKKDSANTMWLANSAQAQYELADIAFKLDQSDIGQEAFNTAKAQISEALARDKSRTRRQLTGYRVATLEAEQLAQQGDEATAQTLAADLVRRLDGETDAYMRSNGALAQYANAMLLYGQLLANSGNIEAAREQWERTASLLLSAQSTLDLTARGYLAEAHALLGNTQTAERILDELDALGYRPSARAISANSQK